AVLEERRRFGGPWKGKGRRGADDHDAEGGLHRGLKVAAHSSAPPKPTLRSCRMAARTLALLNAVVVVALWVHGGGLHDEGLTSLGRLTGLLGAYLALVELVFLPRGPRSSVWHRYAGHAVLWLLLAHTVLITAGYARADRTGVVEQVRRLIEEFPGVITAFAALA